MNKNVAVVLSYCNTDEKITILNNLLDELNTHKLDICLISPLMLSNDIQSKCDYFIYTKDNPILSWPEEYGYHYWVKQKFEDIPFTMNYMDNDYYWTVLYQIKTTTTLLKTIKYDSVILMNYDLNILNNPLKCINNDENFMFKTRFDENDTAISPLLLSKWSFLDFVNISDSISKEDYIRLGDLSENYLKSIIERLNIKYRVPDIIICDLKSHYTTSKKMETWSDIDEKLYGFKLYCSNMNEFSIWVYEFTHNISILYIKLVFKDNTHQIVHINSINDKLIKTEYQCSDIKSCIVVIDSESVDISDIFEPTKPKQFIEYV